jgi:hypothetical protein
MNRVIKATIYTENPAEHWGFLPVNGKIILDLGSGINSEFTPTPMYWIEKKAAKVIGVDPSQQSYDWFKQNYLIKNFINIMDYVDRIEKFELYLGYYKPQIVKIDVEGGELYLNGLDSKYLDGVTDIGIEYHNFPSLVSCERLLKDNGYTIEYYKFNDIDIDHQGVIHAFKIK